MAASSQHRGAGKGRRPPCFASGLREATGQRTRRYAVPARSSYDAAVEVGGSNLAAFRNVGQAAKPTGQPEIEFTTGGLGIAG
jgi:hypothetical protein